MPCVPYFQARRCAHPKDLRQVAASSRYGMGGLCSGCVVLDRTTSSAVKSYPQHHLFTSSCCAPLISFLHCRQTRRVLFYLPPSPLVSRSCAPGPRDRTSAFCHGEHTHTSLSTPIVPHATLNGALRCSTAVRGNHRFRFSKAE